MPPSFHLLRSPRIPVMPLLPRGLTHKHPCSTREPCTAHNPCACTAHSTPCTTHAPRSFSSISVSYDSKRVGAQKVTIRAQPDVSRVPSLANALAALGLRSDAVALNVGPTGAELGISQSWSLDIGAPFAGELL